MMTMSYHRVIPVEATTLSALPATEKRHLFVSNRSPYLYHETGSSLKASKAIGGLVSTMEPAFRKLGGLWIGSSDGSSEPVRLVVGEDEPRCFTKPVNLSDEDIELYYNGFANGTLWPLCHSFLEKCHFNTREWQAYERVNRKFASAIAAELLPSHDVVWIHDYHLALTPQFVREEVSPAKIVSFWHIPFPDPAVFLELPWRRRVLEGLLHSRFIGFHLQSYVDNFLYCVEREFANANVDHDTGVVRLGILETLIRAAPLGIDHLYWDSQARSQAAADVAKEVRSRIKAQTLALAVDRLDYTKGVVERIRALECLFLRRPDLIECLTLLQIGVPTRTGVPVYRDYRDAVVKETERVNTRFGRNGWKPVVLEKGMISQKRLAGLYLAADLAIVTPLRDGMNLVAKEFVASRVDGDGVLVLSRSAGVADELTEAILVDPRKPAETAKAIERALSLSPGERRQRMELMRQKVKVRNLFWWLRSISDLISNCGDGYGTATET
jgi:trehalose-6-phosphate synthase